MKSAAHGCSWISSLLMISRLERLVHVFWLMVLDLFFLKGSTTLGSMLWDVYGFSMTLGNLSAHVECCVSVLLKDWCGVSGNWCLLAFG